MEQQEGDLVTAARKLGVQTRTAWPENLSAGGTDGTRCRYILLKALFRFSLTLCLCLRLDTFIDQHTELRFCSKDSYLLTLDTQSLKMNRIILRLTSCTGIGWLTLTCQSYYETLNNNWKAGVNWECSVTVWQCWNKINVDIQSKKTQPRNHLHKIFLNSYEVLSEFIRKQKLSIIVFIAQK